MTQGPLLQDRGSTIEATLAALSVDPGDSDALPQLAALLETAPGGEGPAVSRALSEGKRAARERGDFELCVRLLDLEIGRETSDERRADLWFEKGRVLADELLREAEAISAFERVLDLRPGDETAEDALGHLALVRDNWQKILHKYLDEAKSSTDRQLTGSLYLSVAELYAKYQPGDDVERYLKKALEVDPRSQKASMRLERLYRAAARWDDLSQLFEQRAEAAPTREERLLAYLALGEHETKHRARPAEAAEAYKKALGIDPTQPRALSALVGHYTATESWSPLIRVYENMLKARPRGEAELGTLLQIAMIWWKKLGNLEAADEYWKRIRKLEPAHPAMLEFYRVYHEADAQQLVPILQTAQRSGGDDKVALAVETARAAESSKANAERTIDLWKAVLRASPGHPEAVAALERLYERTEKWNALLELHKEAIDGLSKAAAADPAAADALTAQRIERLLAMVRIYRDRLALDMMVVSTYGQVLALRPDHAEALTALAQRYEALGRWNDLINVLQRRADITADRAEKATLLRRVADLWIDKFGNLHQAVRPLEELWALDPADADVLARLRDLYTRRRTWRALLDLERKEEARLAGRGGPDRRAKLVEIARLTAERLGDAREAIASWNRVLELDTNDAEALAALAGLYEREKRWLSLVEVLRRQARLAPEKGRVGLLERAASVLVDRLAQAERGAELYKEILALQPGHARATRTLQTLFAQEGRLEDLVALYGRTQQWDELYEVLHQTAERLPAAEGARRVAMLSRAAELAQTTLHSPDKAARAYERILALDTERTETTRDAARALLPIYRASEKWARLLASYEVLLGFASEPADQLALIREIRELCENKLGSRGLAFSWAARAYALAPDDAALEADLERLAEEAETWDELAELYAREIGDDRPVDRRVRRLRRLAEIARARQHRPDDARRYYELVLELVPGDAEALSALEQLFSEGQSYPQLLRVYKQRESSWRGELQDRLDLLFKIAWIEEEKLNDTAAARASLQRVLSLDPPPATELRALRALERIETFGGAESAPALIDVLERQLKLAEHDEARVELLLRLAALASTLGRPAEALARLERAIGIDPDRRATHSAIEQLLDNTSGPRLDAEGQRAALARLVPAYEERLKIATGDEVGRTTARLVELLAQQLAAETGVGVRGGLLTRLAQLAETLPDTPERRRQRYAWAAERFLHDPASRELRHAFLVRAEAAGQPDDAAVRLAEVESKIEDVELRRELALTQAALFEGPLGMPDDAEAAYRRVQAIDPADPVADAALERLFKAKGRHQELRALLVARKERTHDVSRRVEVLTAICELDEGVLDDREAATDSWRELLELDPQSVRAFRALERIYAGGERWSELASLLEAREPFQPSPHENAEVRGTPESRAHFRFRRAELTRDRLSDLTGALDLYEQVLAEEPSHEGTRRVLEALVRRPEARVRVARMMQPIYEADQAWPKLALVLGAERETLEGADAVPLLQRLAQLQEEKLGARQLALATWREVLRIDPRDERARASVERLALLLGRHADLAAAWDEAYLAAEPSDLPLRADLLARSARLYERELRDTQKAEAAWRRLFDLDPSQPDLGRPAAVALERLYESQESWARLVEILRRQVEWSASADERRQLLHRIARIQEELLVDPAAATATYREILEADPADKSALDGLEKLHAAKSEWPELLEVLRRRLELENEARARRELLFRIALLTERELGDPAGAVPAYGAVLEEFPEDLPALDALGRLHEVAGRKSDLLDVIERRIRLEAARLDSVRPDPKAQGRDERNLAGLRMRAAALEIELGRPEAAMERYREVLDRDGRHEGALRALEALLPDPDLRLRVAELLEPRYVAMQDTARLLTIHELLAEAAPDLRERMGRLERAAALRGAAGQGEAAFDLLAKAARVAVGESDLAPLLDRLEAATPAGARGRLVALYQDLAPDILDAGTQERVNLTVAAESERLGDRATAREYYRRVLDASPDHPRALGALEGIYAAGEEWGALYEVYVRRAELAAQAQNGEDTRRRYLLLGAQLCETKLDRPTDAIPAYEEALQLQPADVETSRALERHYEATRRWHELGDLLERRLGFTDDLDEAIAVRVRLGQLFEQELTDPDRAVESYRAALGGDPNHKDAIAALERYLEDGALGPSVAEVLEPVYVARHDWLRLVRVCEIRLSAAEDPRARLGLRRRIARIYEEQLEDLDAAFVGYTRVYLEDPTDRPTRDQLARLAGVLSAWERLAAVYEEHVSSVGPDGEGAEDALRALASIYHERLADVDRARDAYGRLLERNRDDEVAFFNLEKLLERAQRWPELLAVYRDAAEATLDISARRTLLGKAAAVAEQRLADLDVAVQLQLSIAEADPADEVALAALDRLYTRGERWHDLAELIERRSADRGEDLDGWVNDKLRLAELRADKLEDKSGAIELYEEILARRPREPRVVRALEKIIVEPEHTFRIAQLLGPIYREEGSWQKLVVIHEAVLEYLDDRRERLELLTDLAQLHEKQGGNPKRAFDALLRAWRDQAAGGDDPDAVEQEGLVFAELCRLAEPGQLFRTLCDELERAVKDSSDDGLRARVYRRVARLAEERLGDRGRAVDALRSVLDAEDSDEASWDALLRLLAADGRARDLVGALERRAGITNDPDLRRSLHERAAAVYEEQLREAEPAIAAWNAVLEIEPEDTKALSALTRLYRSRGDLPALADTLDRQIAIVTDAPARRALRAELAALAAGGLHDPARAADLWRAALADDARDRDALVELRKVELSVEHHAEALEATDALIELTPPGPERDALMLEGAELLERKLGDAEGALQRYASLVAPEVGGIAAPGAAAQARRELERLARERDTRALAAQVLEPAYERAGEWLALVELGELVLETERDAAERRAWLGRMAEAQERAGTDKKPAFSIWARALREEPGDAEARAALERLAESEAIPGELARVYEELITTGPEPEILRSVALRLGALYDERIGDEERAIAAYSRVIEASAGDEVELERTALKALDRLLSRAGRPRDLAEVLERQAAAADDTASRVGFLHRLGALRASELVDLDGALAAFRDALELDEGHAGALGGLEALLESEPHREAALDVLEPLAERRGEVARQNALAEVRLQTLRDEAEQVALLERIAERAENALHDQAAAFAAVGRALSLAPGEERLAEEAERLAAVGGRPTDAALLFERTAADARTPEVRRLLRARAGRLWEATGDDARAEQRYLELVSDNAEDQEALEALERVYRVRGDAAHLADILTRRAAVELDVSAQRALYAEAARLAEEALSDTERAIQLWQSVLRIEEGDEGAISALARLYEIRGRWPELADLLSNAARLADDAHAQASLLGRVAAVSAERLHDLPRAIAALRELLDLEPDAMAAIDSLIELEGRRGDEIAIKEALERKLGASPQGPARIPVFRRLADLAARRDEIDDALGYLYEILALDPADAAAGQAQRALLEKAERWNDLVDILTAEAGRRADAGDTAGELALLVQAADLWEARLESPESATDILERILARDPANVRALLSLARIAESSGDTARAREMLAGAEAHAREPRDVAELAYRRGRVEADAGEDAAALTHYRRALAADPSHAAALAAVLTQARAAGDHATVAQLLEAALGAGKDDGRAARLELAKLYIEKLGTPDRARPHLEALLASGDPAARELLAELHFAAGRLDEAQPLYAALLEAAVAGKKRGKELARLHLRLGEIAEKKGDLAGALASFSEAQRIDGGHAPTLVAMGRLHRQKGDWESARKTYRSLLLQNLDPDAGISKAGVYLALGEIHEKLNEGPKAIGMYERGLELQAASPQAAAELAALKDALARLRGA